MKSLQGLKNLSISTNLWSKIKPSGLPIDDFLNATIFNRFFEFTLFPIRKKKETIKASSLNN